MELGIMILIATIVGPGFVVAVMTAGRIADWWRRGRNASIFEYIDGRAYRFPSGAYYR